jgi:hypothetical protein
MHLDDERQENIEAFEATFLALFRIASTLGRLPQAMQSAMQQFTDAEAELIVGQFYKKKSRRSRSIGTALQGLGSAASGMVDAVARRGRSTHGASVSAARNLALPSAGALRPVDMPPMANTDRRRQEHGGKRILDPRLQDPRSCAGAPEEGIR